MKKLLVGAMIGALVLSMSACDTQTASSSAVVDPAEQAAEAISTEASTEAAASTEAEASSEVVYEEPKNIDYSGTFTEPMTGRCVIEIVPTEGDNYTVNVHWSSSAFESANWEINATYYESTSLLEYTDAKYYIRTYTDEENYTDDVQYTDGAGEFWFEEDGMLGWRSANSDVDGITGDTQFERLPE